MSASALIHPAATPSPGRFERLRAVAATGVAAVLGAAPHVLHHAGPLAGAAILAGATGKLLFGLLGLVLAVPMLRRIRGRTGSWRVPGGVLALMAAAFVVSSFVIGPALTGSGETQTPTKTTPGLPAGVSPSEHESHHR